MEEIKLTVVQSLIESEFPWLWAISRYWYRMQSGIVSSANGIIEVWWYDASNATKSTRMKLDIFNALMFAVLEVIINIKLKISCNSYKPWPIWFFFAELFVVDIGNFVQHKYNLHSGLSLSNSFAKCCSVFAHFPLSNIQSKSLFVDRLNDTTRLINWYGI